MDQMQKQAAHVGTEIINSQVTEVFLNEDIKKLNLDNGTTLNAKTVIINLSLLISFIMKSVASFFSGTSFFKVTNRLLIIALSLLDSNVSRLLF